jgi:hypothetical protein
MFTSGLHCAAVRDMDHHKRRNEGWCHGLALEAAALNPYALPSPSVNFTCPVASARGKNLITVIHRAAGIRSHVSYYF